jgi:hypothetical protein
MKVFLHVLCLSLILFQTSAFARDSPSSNARQSSGSNSVADRCLTTVQMLPAGYAFALANYHLATESVTAGFMAGVGDMVGKFRKSECPNLKTRPEASQTLPLLHIRSAKENPQRSI